ncbi:MAG: DASS family sodium-coupled anion symporter [Cyclobacteriaceae bacterium]
MVKFLKKYGGLALGPALFVIILFGTPFDDLSVEANATLATTAWVAIWWVSEVIPIPATSLLPIVLLPLSGAAPIGQTTAAYGDKMLFLFIGGFIIAIGMEKWDLHKRIALNIIKFMGTRPDRILLGFMVATGALSMWISNTATTLMMVTIGIALIHQSREKLGNAGDPFFKALLLGIAYSASIGGVATLVGTPTNPIFAALASELYADDISFASWMIFGAPFSILMVLFCWWYLSRIAFKLDRLELNMGEDLIQAELDKLGKIKYEEKMVAWVFGLTAFVWISRTFFLNTYIPHLNDTSVAIAAAISLFIIPSRRAKNLGLISWEEAVKIPWGVILLFGGGLAIAASFRSSGLAAWIGNQLTGLESLPVFLIILFVTLIVNFLTEVTSNVATASIILPVLAAFSEAIGIHPYLLMVPATMAASCAFMLPMATGPNAIVFASNQLKIRDMARAGFAFNLISSLIISTIGYFILTFLG